MLKLINSSTNRKTGNIATTYRSGATMYGSCPKSCALNPNTKESAKGIDKKYLTALINAVVKNGLSWTYSHFDYKKLPRNKEKKTVINYSADTLIQALNSFNDKRDTVYTAPSTMTDKVDNIQGVKFVRCPSEYNEKIKCQNCGSGKPLCARINRDYIIKFVAHGSQKKKVGKKEKGGCYAGQGFTRFAWQDTTKRKQDRSDHEKLTAWVKTLPYGTFIRHHVAGDIGK